MTSTILVKAHCADTKHVVVEVDPKSRGFNTEIDTYIIEDGEEQEFTVYDNVEVGIVEIDK